MFEWIKNWFKSPTHLEPRGSQYYYVASVRGQDYARAATKQDAETAIRELFNSIDGKRVGGKGFGTHQNSTYDSRWKGFRNQCKITRYCGTCGKSGNGCGQC